MCQRNVADHFPALIQHRLEYLAIVRGFFYDHIHSRFPEDDYTFDIYLTSTGKVSCSRGISLAKEVYVVCLQGTILCLYYPFVSGKDIAKFSCIESRRAIVAQRLGMMGRRYEQEVLQCFCAC